jgi:hypothetical protein
VNIGHRPRHRHAAPRRRHARTTTGAGRRRAVLASAAPIGLLTCCALVWQSSAAAFTATTDNPANAWTTGVVTMTSDRTSAALFTTKNPSGPTLDSDEELLVPGSSGSRCITVKYTGSVPTADTGVRMYGKVTGGYDPLAAALEVTVEISGPGATSSSNCAGFVAAPGSFTSRFKTFPANYTSGLRDLNAADSVPDWRPSATTDLSRVYRISYSLPAATANPDDLQGKSVTMTFTWEAQSDDTPGT